MRNYRVLVLPLLLSVVSVNAQIQYPNLRSVALYSTVTSSPGSAILSYNYSVHNGATSNGSIIRIEIDISSNPASLNYDTTGLRFKNSFVESYFRRSFPGLQGKIVPIGFPNSPSYWFGGLTNSLLAAFRGDSRLLVSPGQNLSGFTMTSRGLPSIRTFIARPYFNVDSLFLDMEDPNRTITLAQEDSIRQSTAFSGITVAPQAPPARFLPLNFIDTITSYVSRSRTLGWITNQTTADKYTNYLGTGRSQLQSANISGALATFQSVITSTSTDSSSVLTPEAYGLIRFNTQYLITLLQPAFQVKGGIFNPQSTSTLSVRAKPDSNFTSGDTVIAITATIRWQSRYTLTLGTVSSPTYGFSKYGTVTTIGSYNYQQFRTTTHLPLNWTAGSEYELFTVAVNGSDGVEDFTLTNALPGGQWFVDINYLDKTDSLFYQPVATCTGLAWQNKADNGGVTFHNGSRHLAKTSTKLHEVYSSGGEIVYRRKDLSASWEVTQRISSDSVGAQNDPCVIVAHDGSIHVVWQRWLAATSYDIWYNRSTDGGTTWGTPKALAQTVSIIQDQWNVFPVIAEYGTSQLVAVWCTGSGYTTGLQYDVTSNLGQTWGGATALASSGSVTWYPSLVAGSNFLMLTYDGRSNGVFSRIYNGSWQVERSVSSGDGMLSDRCSSVSVDDQSKPVAAWCAQSYNHTEYTIVYRSGNTDGTWGSGFVEFGVDSSTVSDLYPSLTYLSRSGVYGIDIIYAATNNWIKVNKSTSGYWPSPVLLSNTGQWVNTSIANQTTSPGYPIRVWTDQSGSPNQVVLQSDGTYSFQKVQAPPGSTTDLHRRIVAESQRTRSSIWFDVGPLRLVTTTNDTTVIPFKVLDLANPFTATISSAWDYLGTDQVTLPTNARFLILDAQIQSQARQDSMGTLGTNVFTASTFRLDGVKSSQTVPLLSNQPSITGRQIIDVSQQAGQAIALRVVGSIPATATEPVTIGVGDVYVPRKP